MKMQGEAADKHASANLKQVQAQRLQAEIPNVQAQAPKTIAETQKLVAETHATKTDALATAVGVHQAHHDQQFQHDLQQDDQMHRQGWKARTSSTGRDHGARRLCARSRVRTPRARPTPSTPATWRSASSASREDAANAREDAAAERRAQQKAPA
jgi:hypothetical protein